jgi:transcriptional regulator GlxA family with amidase domain
MEEVGGVPTTIRVIRSVDSVFEPAAPRLVLESMERREFLTMAASLGLAVPALAAAKAVAEGEPLAAPKDGPIQVAIAVSEWNTWIDFVGPQAVFDTFRFDPETKRHVRAFEMHFVGETLAPKRNLVPDYTFENAPQPHIVLVGAQKGSPALIAWLKKVAPGAQLTMSVCTGAAHLAQAGLLDGIKATSHHEAIADFKKEYPKVEWISGMRFVEGKRISTGGGLTAGIDLALRVVERYHGRARALEVAEHLEYEGRGWIV